MTSSLLDLAERCERLTGPCRETDARIVIALDLRPEWCAKGGKLWIDLEANPADPPIRYANTCITALTDAQRYNVENGFGALLRFEAIWNLTQKTCAAAIRALSTTGKPKP